MFLHPSGRVPLSFHIFCFHVSSRFASDTVYDIDPLSEKITDSDVESASPVSNAGHCTQAP